MPKKKIAVLLPIGVIYRLKQYARRWSKKDGYHVTPSQVVFAALEQFFEKPRRRKKQ